MPRTDLTKLYRTEAIGTAPTALLRSEDTADLRKELILRSAGAFRPVLEEYLNTGVLGIYVPPIRNFVRASLSRFFRFLVEQEVLNELEQIRPSTITRFIADQRYSGARNYNLVGKLSSFFDWAIITTRMDVGNPVVPKLHRPQVCQQSVLGTNAKKGTTTDVQ